MLDFVSPADALSWACSQEKSPVSRTRLSQDLLEGTESCPFLASYLAPFLELAKPLNSANETCMYTRTSVQGPHSPVATLTTSHRQTHLSSCDCGQQVLLLPWGDGSGFFLLKSQHPSVYSTRQDEVEGCRASVGTWSADWPPPFTSGHWHGAQRTWTATPETEATHEGSC